MSTNALRESFKTAVLKNAIKPEERWAQPCSAYNVQIQPSLDARRSLSAVQDRLLELEPNLLRVPLDAMHISVAWLLAVRQLYPLDKDVLWQRHGSTWLADVARIAAASDYFPLTYRSVIATDTAVVALAEPPERVNLIRGAIARTVRLPPETRNRAALVHSTLFRYRSPLRDPSFFLRATERTELAIGTTADALVVSREEIFPSLKTTVLGRYPLGGDPRDGQGA
jgi:hypothetical protein